MIYWPDLHLKPINLYNLPKGNDIMATVGELADLLWETREEKRAHAVIEKEINARIENLEHELLISMAELGIEGGKATHATFSVSKVFTPRVEDWDAFYAYVTKTGYFHLLHKRLSAAGCEEIFAKEHLLPGVIPDHKTTIRLTTRSDKNE